MRQLTIYRRYFTGADCYTRGTKQTSVGVQVHSTGANNPYLKRYVQPNDGRLGNNANNNSHNRKGLNVCASAYIGRLADGTVAVYQTLPWNYRCWLSGKGKNGNANRLGYIGYEICEDDKTSEAYFREAVMTAAVNLTAHLCTLFGTTPQAIVRTFADGSKALAVMEHRELHSAGLASNHADIRHWSSKFGVTMDDFRAAVLEAMQEGVDVTYIDCDSGNTETIDGKPTKTESEGTPLYQAKVTSPGKWLNIRAAKNKSAVVLAEASRGVTVDVLDDTDTDWWQVQYNSVTGYAMTGENGNTYLTPVDDAQEQPDDADGDEGEEATPDTDATLEERLTSLEETVKELKEKLTALTDGM